MTIPFVASAPLPHALQAEACALGAVFIKPDCFRFQVAGVLKADDFFLPAHRYVFEVMQALEARQHPAGDLALVADELKVRGWDQRLEGGESFLLALASSVPTAENVDHYVGLVKEKSQLRQLWRLGADLQAMALAALTPALDIIAQVNGQLSDIAVGRIELEEVGAWDDTVQVFEEREKARLEGRRPDDAGITIGIAPLDKIIVGFTPQNTYIFTGKPGGGKSSALRKAALHVVEQGGAFLLCSQEMSRRECIQAMYSNRARVSTFRAKHGVFDVDEWQRIMAVEKQMRTARLVIDETANDIGDVENLVGQWAAKLPPEVRAKSAWGIDYIQLTEDRTIRENATQVIRSVSRRAKKLSRRVNMPGFIVAQLNREASSDGVEPGMRHLEGSGALEKDSTAVIFFDVEKVDGKATGKAAGHIWKNRSGPTGMAELLWDAETYDFAPAHQAVALGETSGHWAG